MAYSEEEALYQIRLDLPPNPLPSAFPPEATHTHGKKLLLNFTFTLWRGAPSDGPEIHATVRHLQVFSHYYFHFNATWAEPTVDRD